MKTQDCPPYLRDFNNLARQLEHRHDGIQVFVDFLDMTLGGFLLNDKVGVPVLDHGPETDYERSLVRYNAADRAVLQQLHVEFFRVWASQQTGRPKAELGPGQFENILLGLDACYQQGQWSDILGDYYQELSARSKASALGQFFTPPEICNLMARVQPVDEAVEGRAPWTPTNRCYLNEPCAGSGRMVLALHAQKPGCVFAVAQDVDPICCKMTVLNLLLHGVPGQVQQGNALDPDDFVRCWELNRLLYFDQAPAHLQVFPHLRGLPREQAYLTHFWEARAAEVATVTAPREPRSLKFQPAGKLAA